MAGINAGYNAVTGVGSETIELGITASGTIATPVVQLSSETVGTIAFYIGAVKFAIDTGTFLYGYGVKCE